MNDLSKLNFQHLQYLIVLIEERHVTRAAEKLDMSQPSMSSALARLRQIFNDPLLVKTSSGLEPTARALDLSKRAVSAIDLLTSSTAEAEDYDPAAAMAHLHIMASNGIADLIAPRLLGVSSVDAPNIKFTIEAGDIRRTAEYLRDGRIDLVLGFAHSTPDDLMQTLLYPQRTVCIARKGHPRIKGTLTMDAYASEQHVVWGALPVPHPTLEVLIAKALKEVNLKRRVAVNVASLSTSAALVAGTDLIATVPEGMTVGEHFREKIQILPLPFPTLPFDVQMLWHERWQREPTHRWVRSTLQRLTRDLRSQEVRMDL